MMKRVFAVAVVLILSSPLCRSETAPKHTYQTVRVADGISAFIASESDTGIVSGNCVAVIGEDGVLVVDSTNFPSHARQIIAEIKQTTNQPVRFLVHTHWHPDHLMGDGEFRAAYPDVTIISTRYTQEQIIEQVPKFMKSNLEETPAYAVTLRKQVQDGKDEDGKELSAAYRKLMTDYARSIDFAVPEFKQAKFVVPNLAFENALTITLGKREVQLLFLGRGNTGGDAVIFVPDAKVVVTGDLLVAPTPYSFGSFLSEWLQTLDKVKALGATTIVPGHGPVEHDYRYLDLVCAALQSVLSQVREAVAKGLTLEDTRKRVDFSALKSQFAGDDTDRQIAFQLGLVDPAVERAYQEVKFKSEE